MEQDSIIWGIVKLNAMWHSSDSPPMMIPPSFRIFASPSFLRMYAVTISSLFY